jgi:hypothetical protein
MSANTTASGNTAVGRSALQNNTAGGNTAVGFEALQENTTGYGNVGVGLNAGHNVTTGNQNTLVGGSFSNYVGGSLTTGAANTLVGTDCGKSITTSDENTAVGSGALTNCTTGANNIVIGRNAGTDAVLDITTESNRLVLGNNNITNAYVKTTIAVTSDQRDKTDIVDIGSDRGLSFVEKLRPVSFYYNENRDKPDVKTGFKRYGFLAQEVLALEGSDNVIINNEDTNNLKYHGEALVPVLVKAVQELSTKVAELEAKIGD